MIGKEHLNWCAEARDLDTFLDYKLQFNQHIASVVRKARACARFIARSICSQDFNVLMKAFVTYVRPMLE
jgi:hypothetical protein